MVLGRVDIRNIHERAAAGRLHPFFPQMMSKSSGSRHLFRTFALAVCGGFKNGGGILVCLKTARGPRLRNLQINCLCLCSSSIASLLKLIVYRIRRSFVLHLQTTSLRCEPTPRPSARFLNFPRRLRSRSAKYHWNWYYPGTRIRRSKMLAGRGKPKIRPPRKVSLRWFFKGSMSLSQSASFLSRP